MQSIDILRQTQVNRTARVMQLEGIFQIPQTKVAEVKWHLDFELPTEWHVGAVIGPSGSGKSTFIGEAFPGLEAKDWPWRLDHAVVDDFPAGMGINDITQLLSSVGFSSPPAWLRPYAVLSNGEKFRCHVARTLAEMPDIAVIDEFTSVVDRTVAQIGSNAVAKTVRRSGRKLIVASCHYDIVEWLCPDWIFEPGENRMTLARGSLRRPDIELEISRCGGEAWHMFKAHHYLSAELSKTASCYLANYRGRTVAFDAWMPFFGSTGKEDARKAWRGHRTVCLPDFQGAGIGNALFETIASAYSGIGYRAFSNTSHIAEISKRLNSPKWKVLRYPSRTAPDRRAAGKRACDRLSASFEWIGPKMPNKEAEAFVRL